MTVNKKTGDKRLQNDVKERLQKYKHYYLVKLGNIIFLQLKNYFFLIKVK